MNGIIRVVPGGLARGIDGVAHRAALDAGGRTLAVLAGGLARIYPPEHAGLADDVAKAGALLTESSMDQEPLAVLFPPRNRIISGLSQAVVVIEAAERSGALITASLAGEQGRVVCAVPGPVDSPASGGTNELIRKGAVLVRGVEDVLEELHALPVETSGGGNAAPVEAAPPPGMDAVQQRVWDALAGGARHVDEVAAEVGMDVARLGGVLLMLEMRRVVRRLPGNRYERG